MNKLEKLDVVKFLMAHHKMKYKRDISPIKLQKGLYFLYAFYIKYRNAVETECDDSVINSAPNTLFDANFEAWSYGPVDPEIYVQFKTNKINIEGFNSVQYLSSLSKKNSFMSEFLEGLTQQIFNSGDFGLVELSHRDACWKEHSADRSSITEAEIIDEYSNKT